MIVLCKGYFNDCDSPDCEHNIPHEHSSGETSCDRECCYRLPYKCSEETYIIYLRKLKLEKLNEGKV